MQEEQTFVRQELREGVVLRRPSESVFEHRVVDDLLGALVVAHHDALVHDHAWKEKIGVHSAGEI